VAAAHTRQGSHYFLGRKIPFLLAVPVIPAQGAANGQVRHNLAVLGLWKKVVGLLREPDPSPAELAERLEADAELRRAKDKWLADEARQARQSCGTGPGI
jgi:hypothetical protein